jgi:hypothetical protein
MLPKAQTITPSTVAIISRLGEDTSIANADLQVVIREQL